MDAETMKGPTVRRLISYTSWVKYVVRQYGFYLLGGIRINYGHIPRTKGAGYINLWFTCCLCAQY